MKIRFIPSNERVVLMMVWSLRILIGIIFVFSGFVKAVDPWGTMYKFAEYFSVWGFGISREIVLVLAASLSIFEMGLGVITLLGCFRRVCSWMLTIFMSFMTILTLYIYVEDPVSDCGCFGDALILSNGDTLLKNIGLCIAAIYLFKLNHKVKSIVMMKLQWLVALVIVLYGVLLTIVGYHVQPLVDFRSYPVGEVIASTNVNSLDTRGMKFVYEKNGVQQEFDAENIPEDDSWKFIERITPQLSIGDADFVVNDVVGADVTGDVIPQNGKILLVMISNPQRVGLSRSHMIDCLAKAMSTIDGGHFAVVIASDYPGGIDAWSEMINANNYDVYEAEDTDIKMFVRGDIALVYIQDGQIVWKYNAYYFPPKFGDQVLLNPSMIDDITSVEKNYSLWSYTLVAITLLMLIVGAGFVFNISKKKIRLK